ncbi:hypothetical protein ACF1BE_23935 [Streptomyces sp. NPDC014991]
MLREPDPSGLIDLCGRPPAENLGLVTFGIPRPLPAVPAGFA